MLLTRLISASLLFTPRLYRLSSAASHTHKMNLMTISQSLNDSFKKHKIFPDIIETTETKGLLTIQFNNLDSTTVALGNTLKVKETQTIPKIQFTLNSPNNEIININQTDKFTLILTDPDAPSNKDNKWSQYAHWIINDLKLNPTSSRESEGDVQSKPTPGSGAAAKSRPDPDISIEGLNTLLDFSKGKELLSYVGPAPPPKTGKHRYIFFLYKQDPKVDFFEPLKDRPNWGTGIPGYGVKEWVAKHGNMELFGVNFFYALNEQQ